MKKTEEMNELQELRRNNLESIVKILGLSVAAKRFKKPERQINDMIRKRKSFGESVTIQMENNFDPNLTSGWLSKKNLNISFISDNQQASADMGLLKENFKMEDYERLVQFSKLGKEDQIKLLENAEILKIESTEKTRKPKKDN